VNVQTEGQATKVISELDISLQARRVSVAVPALIFALGAVSVALDPRLALLTAVVVLGWTQLVGL
jgi:hypothetical protein